MSGNDLASIAQATVAPGKGILAIDESLGTIKKRLDSIHVESTEENRRAYRELLITAPGGGEYISGMILFDETIRQQTRDGVPFVQALADQGILPGIKVDFGAKDLAGHPGEKVTEGLDGLRERLAEYAQRGAKFAKWRAVITIGEGIPSSGCIEANAHALGRYAALCQEAGLVPIVEPETLMDGDNTIERCYEVTERTLRSVFRELYRQRVVTEHTILKVNMVVPGRQCPDQAGVERVADLTVRCLKNCVPAALAGIVFLSGGQSARNATVHLDAMNRKYPDLPWPLSFSYGRALQEPCLKAWAGRPENVEAAQAALLHREKCNSLAALGRYDESLEEAA
ncbi:Fructose-bisphosphate aldolase class I [Thioalkalivibrio nitratireducens DSM 14787]|uniref:Probable fructose-bisphosphate aldolase class 1 n=1 Tax=Thioalkalivibrio nitratireducens (strain DSM 14787 / UNIQEM 213 / ALEN2) TaxID=1255043 RepID=L0E0D5_THIND|nr:class I fructose-bisphosphate aldolase [Thioalkalivibrio nitratireducens]AGA34707.1 Fructose-bisphosphate aldolase class I [Thioalkalivibrio nitratireducens DSM 14787]